MKITQSAFKYIFSSVSNRSSLGYLHTLGELPVMLVPITLIIVSYPTNNIDHSLTYCCPTRLSHFNIQRTEKNIICARLIINLTMIEIMITMTTMLIISWMTITFWQEQGDDDDDVEVWGATADSGSNGFIRGGGEATEGNSWWTHGSEQVASVHKSTNTEIHFCTNTLLQKYTSTKYTNPQVQSNTQQSLTNTKCKFCTKANDGHKRHKKREELTGTQTL